MPIKATSKQEFSELISAKDRKPASFFQVASLKRFWIYYVQAVAFAPRQNVSSVLKLMQRNERRRPIILQSCTAKEFKCWFNY